MTATAPYHVTFTPAARRRMDKLPLTAAVALFEHLTGPVAENPHRLGKPLETPYDGVWSTRRGEYRALYVTDDGNRTITVLAVAHRRDAYRRA
ncbi:MULTISPECIES: type II toxin-antitoxin system RelE family toxin [Saccharothrix]|uniref:type II toxin-antitoxin system RelE family toxin n=1 Tax=Saccharothrix TaxID=2071 RepID=UPI00093DA86A|nr:type II toxin-antitoxin system RelE/ParE family toxin [Saccharothrix sp. CB00851]OKI37170.1 plasmid stabilization protein [Saccharothrix sp. CB00851]